MSAVEEGSRPVTTSTVSDVIAATLADAGVELAFAFPGGGSNLVLIDALHRSGTRVVLTHSETAGAFMGSTLGELTGCPGVLIVGVGPGVASAINGVAHAFLDRAPVIVVSDRYSDDEAATTAHQFLDHKRLLDSVTKWQATIEPDSVDAQVDEAIRIACEPPQGPVHLLLPRSIARAEIAHVDRERPTRPRTGPMPDIADEAVTALSGATRPVIVVGHEARLSGDQDDLVRLAEMLNAPVLTTYKAKGVFPETHFLSAGLVTGAEIERPLLERADVMLGVGFDAIELLPRPWPFHAQLCSLRADPAEDQYLRPAWTATGDIGAALKSIGASLVESKSQWTLEEIQMLREGMLGELRVSAGGLAAWEVVEAVREETPLDAIVAVDAGAHMFAATWFWRSIATGSFLISNGLATMGFAVPAAVAASLARPDATVIAFTGDGGLLLNGSELETSARTGAKVIVVVLNDASLSLIRVKQEDLGYARLGVDFLPVDFAQYGKALGVGGVRADTVPEVRAAIRDALAAPLSTVIDVRLSGAEYATMHRIIRG